MQGDYMGDYDVIKKDMNHALDSFNMLLIEINSSVVSLAACAGEISDGSQSLSQGSAEQAGAIENLSSTIGRIAEKTANNAENANRVNQIFASARENIMHGSSQMQQMLEAMRSISESSTKISKIIKLIDDIAFQTNILAINATVEAARAGQAGRSFSVVAQEVKNLAGRSANAASETSELIEKSKLDVEAGMKIAENTARSLNQIMSEMDKTAKHVDDISAASKEQATDIMNYNVNLEQISQAVQTNSATTEQSAAASQELADQAATLKKWWDNSN
jgi:methyl-accepting chemotaxis protein